MKRQIPLIITLAAAAVIYAAFQHDALPPEYVRVDSVTQQGEYVEIKGDISQTFAAYKGYSYSIEGNGIYLSVLCNYIPFSVKSFDIKIRLPKAGVKAVYITGGKGEKQLAWSSGSPLVPPAPSPAPSPAQGEIRAAPQP